MAQLVVVLTGGIASGKTQVSDELAHLGWSVIDADIVARNVVARNSAGWHALVKRFGSAVLQQDGEINRQLLRNKVFNDAAALADLNAITHPLITASIKTAIDQAEQQRVLVVIPLLTESNRHSYFNRVLVVDVDENTQLRRLQKRDQLGSQLANKMLTAQISREQRIKLADDIISNQSSLQALSHSVKLMHGFYVSLTA